ncbi:hypothetical protein BN946_scf184901.g10 [Trametes cinnabarina]|uniref:Uncharacterized protein n=1 Tax=Pycnoporus cinnabarinus TaxID=5643 RepID=A0A060SWL1_PYCCI|nr:hypothetical protein BN946_scf184901.g10 [Trametes cinnabarina]
MQSTLILNIPMLMAAMAGEYIVFEAPTPPPSDADSARFGGSDVVVGKLAKISATWIAVCFPRRPTRRGCTPLTPVLCAIAAALSVDIARVRHHRSTRSAPSSAILSALFPPPVRREPAFDPAGVRSRGVPHRARRRAPKVGASGSWLKESGILDTCVGRWAFAAWKAYLLVVMLLVVRRMSEEDAVLRREFKGVGEEDAHNAGERQPLGSLYLAREPAYLPLRGPAPTHLRDKLKRAHVTAFEADAPRIHVTVDDVR